MWFALATRLATPVQRVMRETTSREFVKWKKVLKDEMNTPTRADYYAAATAAEVRRSYVKKPNAVKIEDFILEFKEAVKAPPITEEVLEQRIEKSKNAWFGFVGGKTRKPPPQKGKAQ